MNESLQGQTQENTPVHLEPVKLPGKFFDVLLRIQTEIDIKRDDISSESGHNERKTDAVEGFEDILGEPLGSGERYYNTFGCIYQLALALSVATNPAINEILQNKEIPDGSEVVKALRKARVLSGLKIIDLACGIPNLALAARALGADVYTVDVDDLKHFIKTQNLKHVAIDLNDKESVNVLKQITGGDFDIVTEHAIGTVPSNSRIVERPKSENVVRIADALLKNGGFLYRVGEPKKAWLLQKSVRS